MESVAGDSGTRVESSHGCYLCKIYFLNCLCMSVHPSDESQVPRGEGLGALWRH